MIFAVTAKGRSESMIKPLKDKISYAIICEKFPVPRLYFDSYELAEKWLKLEQPNNKPHCIVKRTEHFEICKGNHRDE